MESIVVSLIIGICGSPTTELIFTASATSLQISIYIIRSAAYNNKETFQHSYTNIFTLEKHYRQ
jgi:hypothetical protein